jgi:DNA-binding MarR family transcriptional regulator
MPKPKAPPDTPGRYSYDGLERAIHEKARLGIMTSLASHPDGLLFPELKDLCALTDGNLSRHLQVLHEEGLVEIWKGTRHNRPQTLCRLTPEGRRRFQEYIAVLESVVADAVAAAKVEPDLAARKGLAGGWSPA